MRKELSRLGKSFRYAFQGLYILIRSERNMQLHVLATVVVLCAGSIRGLSLLRWALLLLAIGVVWLTEALNTALERLANAVSKAHHPLIGQAKDIGAAAVLIAAVLAAAIGILVFLC